MEYKCASFKKSLLLFLMLFVLNFCFAQKRIIFLEKIKGNKEMQYGQSYYLPRIVSCKINDLPSQKLILESIHGDTFYFKTTEKDSVVLICLYQDIEIIQFHNKRFYAKKTIAACTDALTFVLSATSMILLTRRNEISSNNKYVIVSFIIASVVSFTTGATINYKLPPKITHKKYSLFVK